MRYLKICYCLFTCYKKKNRDIIAYKRKMEYIASWVWPRSGSHGCRGGRPPLTFKILVSGYRYIFKHLPVKKVIND